MNPDYYKTKEKKLYKHELGRVTSMGVLSLDVRYGKMTKQKDKIGAFYEALVDEKRAPLLREKIAKDLGYDDAADYDISNNNNNNKEKTPTTTTTTMEFIKVLKNEDDCKQALFLQPESGKHYLYSYVNHDMAHETMVFPCDSKGMSNNMQEVAVADGYEPSKDMMVRVMEKL